MAVYTTVARSVMYGWPNRGYTEQDVSAIEETVRRQLPETDGSRVRFIYGDERKRGLVVQVKLGSDDDTLGAEVEKLVQDEMKRRGAAPV